MFHRFAVFSAASVSALVTVLLGPAGDAQATQTGGVTSIAARAGASATDSAGWS